MLRIRKEQFDVFQASMIPEANVRLAQYARQRFPGEFRNKPEEDLVCFAAKVRQRAEPRGITTEPDLATALDLTVMYGTDFYDAEWVRDVFAESEWTGAKKLDVVRARVRHTVPGF